MNNSFIMFFQNSHRSDIKRGIFELYALLPKWMDRWSFIVILKKKESLEEMVDEKIHWLNCKGYIYCHLTGCYMQYTVVIHAICSNGPKVLILSLLEIEMFTILVLFNR